MRSEDLLKYIGEIDDRFIDELFEDTAVVRKKPRRMNWGAIAACFALFVLGAAAIFSGGGITSGKTQLDSGKVSIPVAANTIVMLDVNPSVSFEVDDRGGVVSVTPVNDDAETAISGLELTGKDYNEALTETVTAMCEKGYITSLRNSVLLTVLNGSEEQAESIRAAAVDTLAAYDDHENYKLSILSQIMTDDTEFKQLAEQYKVTSGRIKVLESLCETYSDYDLEGIVDNNIQTINQLLEYTGLPDFLQRVGEAAGTVPTDYRKNLGLENLSGSDILSFTSAVSDLYDKLCEYYSEEDVANRIGYVISIEPGNSTDGSQLWAVLIESINEKIDSHSAIINIGKDVVSDWISSGRARQSFEAFVKMIGG